ncbi:serine threonine protein kinase [Aureococcus anophagefferens]|nr:serine threonine protein kinase [Aureococcus anophagefferens]
MGAAASSGQLPEVVDLDAVKSAYALEGYDLDVPRWQKIAEPKGGTLPRAEALRYGPLTKDALQDLMPADVAWSPKLDKRFANMSFGPEEKAAITRGRPPRRRPTAREAGRPADGVVDTLADVYEAASLAKKVFDAKLKSMRGAVGLPEDALVLPPLKGAARAAEKAANDYGSRDPGPGFAWLMDIVRASVVVDTEDQVLAILNHFPKRRGAPAADAGPALLGGNADADGDGDDDGVPDVHTETDAFFFVCELQIHHAGLRKAEKASRRRRFAVGDAADALATLCDDEADAVAFLRTALAIRRREGDGAKVGQTLHNLAGHVAAAARGDDAKLRDALGSPPGAPGALRVWGSRSDKVASTLYGAASVLADLGHGDAARGALERCLSIYEKSLGADHPRAVDAKLKLDGAARDLAGALDVAHAAAAARAAAAAHDDEDAAARADLASALLSVASLLNALDADSVADVLPGAAGDLAAEPVDALLGLVHALDPDGAAPAAAAPKACHPSLAIHAAPAGATVEVPAPLEAVDAGLDVADEAERTYAPGDDAGRGGKIRVEAWLASGAEGDVYRVSDADMGPLAMKVVKAARSENRDAKLVALCAETATFARVGAACPFVVSLRYATVSGPEFASFVDLVEGPPLGDLLAAGGLADADLLSLAEQLGKGLAHVHGRGVIHSDVKPDNLLVGRSGGALHLRITDFGLAATAPEPTADAVGRALAGAAAAADGGSQALTMDALRGCTRKYASPEIAARGAVAWPGGGEHGLAALEAYAAKPTCDDRAAAVRAACGDRVFEQVPPELPAARHARGAARAPPRGARGGPADRPPSASALAAAAAAPGSPAARIEAAHPATPHDAYVGLYNNCGNALAELKEPDKALAEALLGEGRGWVAKLAEAAAAAKAEADALRALNDEASTLAAAADGLAAEFGDLRHKLEGSDARASALDERAASLLAGDVDGPAYLDGPRPTSPGVGDGSAIGEMRAALAVRSCAGPDSAGGRAAAGKDAAERDAGVARAAGAAATEAAAPLDEAAACDAERAALGTRPRAATAQEMVATRQALLAAERTQARARALQEARCAARRCADAEAARACMERLEACPAREMLARYGDTQLERRLAADMCRMEMAGAYKMAFANPFDELKHDFEQWKAERDGLLETLADLSAKGAASTRACEACRESVATRVDAATRLLAGLDVPDRLRRAGDFRSRIDAHVSSSALADVEAGVKDLEARIASVEATLRDCHAKLDALEASTLGPRARRGAAREVRRGGRGHGAVVRGHGAGADEERAWERLRAEEASRIRGLRDDESRARAALADERAALGDLEAWCAAHLGHMMAWIDARAD